MTFLKTCFYSLLFSVTYISGNEYVEGKLVGQLGNQMFIIATTISQALENNAIPIFPDLVKNTNYNIGLNHNKIFFRLNSKTPSDYTKSMQYKEPHFNYKKIPYIPNMCLDGYFQTEKYFIKHKAEICKLFAPSEEISNYLNTTYQEIIHHPKTVSIHVRSYLKEDPIGQYHNTLSSKYFKKAVSYFPNDHLFIVFSNDMEWCKRNLAEIDREMIFIENEPYYHDFYLMSMCKHNIISNSSFSWWAAYLNKNPKKYILAPKKWFSPGLNANIIDLVPNNWRKLRYS